MAGIGKYRAVVVGATGLTGSYVLNLLLEDEDYVEVVTLSRKRINNKHPKHKNHLADLFDPSTYSENLKGDHLYICTGTTQAKTPDNDEYYRIEHDLPVLVSEIALKNGMKKVIAISALGADPESRFRYNRGKGEMERDIEQLGFAEAYFVQPALIGGDREEKRTFEATWKKFQKIIDPLLVGFLRKYRTIYPKTIAQSMIFIAKNGYAVSRIESDELKQIAQKY
ncbi:nucleoside-diphosphate sugar epimerase [Nonlabens spongiae]|uniref:Nucleoside-diphosphate sugar epimerase n=1 Tax=Nonlabens spongiae TaxID=331648 RepID=A0A1W6ML01_9FLAO|nr:NAD-dependent epimerase/dehydratase family protein [Nonlabens spongiae]ARN78263.1 nucleoside-diphosphate sugar epimerase [Nonlabens spongiae]